MMPKIITMINDIIHHQLSFGYDVGKGFIVGEEEVSKHIHDMVADKRVARDLKARSEKGRLDVVKSLGKNALLISEWAATNNWNSPLPPKKTKPKRTHKDDRLEVGRIKRKGWNID